MILNDVFLQITYESRTKVLTRYMIFLYIYNLHLSFINWYVKMDDERNS